MAERESDHKLAWGIFALLLASYAYFYQAGGWNENSRMDLTRSIVDDGTLAIDRYHRNTGDKAYLGGHYYSDKAPGVSLLAVPVYAVLGLFRSAFASEHDFIVFSSWMVTVAIVAAASALTGMLVFRATRRLGVSAQGSVIASLAYGLGTTAFPLSTVLFSHQVAAAMLFGAFFLAWTRHEQSSTATTMSIALLAAGATIVEFPLAPASLLVLAYHARGPERRRRMGRFLGAAAIPALALGTYLFVTFDSPFAVGYQFLAEPTARSGMLGEGVLGLSYPKPKVLIELLFGVHRGLLPYSPVLALAAVGLLSRSRPGWPERRTALLVIAYFLLFVASYEWWQGGSSFGSRHLAPMLPFLALGLGFLADARPKITLGFTVASVAIMTLVTAVQPKPSDQIRSPLVEIIWPAFASGRVASTNICPDTGRAGGDDHRPFLRRARHDAFNVGMMIGGSGPKSLVPLLGLWIGAAFVFARVTRRERVTGVVEA